MKNVNDAANILIQKIRHYLIANMGKLLKDATLEEFYQAFSHSLREEIMINWTATMKTMEQKRARTAYYISMEYLPGRLMDNNITNIGALDVVKRVLEITTHNFHELMISEPDPGLGNGGLGRLASCYLDSLAAGSFPAFGYGLRYQYGIFEQEMWNGYQVERPDRWLLNQNPWEFRRDSFSAHVHYAGRPVPAVNSHGDEVLLLEDFEDVRALPYDIPIIGYPNNSHDFSVITLRLWSTKESPRNFELQSFNAGQLDQASENTSLSDVLYPNDNHDTGKRIRLKQEFLLVSASLQDIIRRHLHVYQTMDEFADKTRIQLNDTHPSLVIPELIRILTKDHDYSFDKAWETVQETCNYTNHTVLKEALEEWNEQRVHYLLPRQFHLLQKLNQRFCDQIRQKFPGDDERLARMSFLDGGQIKMANLLIYSCRRVNGVAALHTNILKNTIFPDFFEMYPEKFINVTNGVTQRRWLLHANPELAEFITKHIDQGWIKNFEEIKKLADIASDAKNQEEFLAIKKKNKERLIDFLHHENPVRDPKGRIVEHYPSLDPDALFDIQIKRIHEYKRQLLNLLHVLVLYQELKENPESRKIKRQVILGGKAAPGYQIAKNIIQFAYILARQINNDPDVNQKLRLAFIENYNVSAAQIIIPAADLSEQISTAGMEASGTGNMKLSINGALTIGTDDGANIEMRECVTDKWWPFCFGATSEENAELKKSRSYQPAEYAKNLKLKKALEALRDGSLTIDDSEKESLTTLHNSLLTGHNSSLPDKYFVLKDFEAYYEAQKRVEELYSTPNKWAEYALHNIAGMGNFSSDTSIKNYAANIWEIESCPIDKELLEKVREEYSGKGPYTSIN